MQYDCSTNHMTQCTNAAIKIACRKIQAQPDLDTNYTTYSHSLKTTALKPNLGLRFDKGLAWPLTVLKTNQQCANLAEMSTHSVQLRAHSIIGSGSDSQ